VARNKWESGLHRPVTVGRVEIGVTYSAGFGFHKYLVCSRRGNVPFHEFQRLSELLDNRSVHLDGHGYLPWTFLSLVGDPSLTTDFSFF
jgi:hypothetical protein